MAFFGVLAVGAVVGAIAHDDYSDWGEYSDAAERRRIAAEKRRIAAEKKRIQQENARTEYRKAANAELERLEDEYDCKLFDNATDKFKMVGYDKIENLEDYLNNKFDKHIQEKIEKEIAKDKKELAEINALISRINKIQLTKKK